MSKSMSVCVAEMSGRTHEITGLKSSDTVKDLYHKMKEVVYAGKDVKVNLVMEDNILTWRDHGKVLSAIGIKDGMLLYLVRNSASEVLEFTGEVGDEERKGDVQSTAVHVYFEDDSRCLLIRETYSKSVSGGSFVWDIYRGTYTQEGHAIVDCTWSVGYRRRRGGLDLSGCFTVQDSGWIQKEVQKIPQSLTKLELDKGAWKTKEVMFQEGDAILGVKLRGRETCAEAITLLALQ